MACGQKEIPRPKWFTKEVYLQYKADKLTDIEIRKILGVSQYPFQRFKEELGVTSEIGKLNSRSQQLPRPEWLTKEKYLEWKKQGLPDWEICENILFVTSKVLKRFKRELGLNGVMIKAGPKPKVNPKEVRKLHESGLGSTAISKRLKCSLTSVYNALK